MLLSSLLLLLLQGREAQFQLHTREREREREKEREGSTSTSGERAEGEEEEEEEKKGGSDGKPRQGAQMQFRNSSRVRLGGRALHRGKQGRGREAAKDCRACPTHASSQS